MKWETEMTEQELYDDYLKIGMYCAEGHDWPGMFAVDFNLSVRYALVLMTLEDVM